MSPTNGLAPAAADAKIKKPLCGYLRLTVDRDGNKIGYDVQQRAGERWAAYAGETIGHWYKDKDITAADRKKDRPNYEQMLTDVSAGMWGGIVVWRLDRLVRLMFEIERCLRLTDDAGAFIVSIDPAVIDSRDPLGKTFMRILVMFAEMEIDAMKARAQAHRSERAKKGMYNGGGHRPFGFMGPVRDADGKYLNIGECGVAHLPEETALLIEAAKRITEEGWSFSEVLDDWNKRTPPVRGVTGKPMSLFTLQRTLTSPRIAGKRECTWINEETGEKITELVKAAWEPIIDDVTWLKLQAKLTTRPHQGPKLSYLLSKRAYCGRCKRPLTGSQRKYRKQGEVATTRTYRCKGGSADKVMGSCGRLSALAEQVEAVVVARVLTRMRNTPRLLEALTKNEMPSTANALATAVNTAKDCDERLEVLAAMFGQRQLSFNEWQTARGPLELTKERTSKEILRLSKTMSVPTPTDNDRKDLLSWFEHLSLSQKQKLIDVFVNRVEILPVGHPPGKLTNGVRFDAGRVKVTFADSDQV